MFKIEQSQQIPLKSMSDKVKLNQHCEFEIEIKEINANIQVKTEFEETKNKSSKVSKVYSTVKKE